MFMHVLVTFFLMWNRVKYAIKIFVADKLATSNFPPKKTRHPDSTYYAPSGEKYVTSGKIVCDIRTHEWTHTHAHTHKCTHTQHTTHTHTHT